ncbi:unnamed protein product [Staurois parvus]|uniref:Uncharacterized protein n=1 Tax=Staurois parvus TaxID=386267 RepID=A0ABN9BJQ2_9NEOB|nr:unnamed protein product [Staurois parvus]
MILLLGDLYLRPFILCKHSSTQTNMGKSALLVGNLAVKQ